MTRLPRRTTPQAIRKAGSRKYIAGYLRRLDPRHQPRVGDVDKDGRKWPRANRNTVWMPEHPGEGYPMYCFVVGE